MSKKKISELPAAGAITGAELVEVVQDGANVQTPASTLSGSVTTAGVVAALAPTASTGTAIAFDVPRTYGYAAAETGNITLNATGLVEGVTQLLIHNHSVEPTFPATMKVIGGTYTISVANYIMLMAVKSNLILVTISQEL